MKPSIENRTRSLISEWKENNLKTHLTNIWKMKPAVQGKKITNGFLLWRNYGWISLFYPILKVEHTGTLYRISSSLNILGKLIMSSIFAFFCYAVYLFLFKDEIAFNAFFVTVIAIGSPFAYAIYRFEVKTEITELINLLQLKEDEIELEFWIKRNADEWTFTKKSMRRSICILCFFLIITILFLAFQSSYLIIPAIAVTCICLIYIISDWRIQSKDKR